MKYIIAKHSILVNQILNNSCTLKVHSVYQKTMNLVTDSGELLAIQKSGSICSPISIILKNDIDFGFYSGDTFTLDSFDYSNSVVFDPNIKKLDFKNSEILLKKLTRILSSSNRDGFCKILFSKDTDAFYYEAARNIISDTKGIIDPEKLSGLIGMGIGLTPGGDDFICGVLAGLYISKKANVISDFKTMIDYSKNRTNDISYEFLKYAADGYFSESVLLLNENPDDDAINKAFLAIGHSSGFDTLCGIQWALSHCI